MQPYRTPNSPFTTTRSALCTVAFAVFSLACDVVGHEANPNNVRPPDEAVHVCANSAGDVYLIQSPDDCEPEDKFVCDLGNYGVGTKVCCSWQDPNHCWLVDSSDQCNAVDTHVCSA